MIYVNVGKRLQNNRLGETMQIKTNNINSINNTKNDYSQNTAKVSQKEEIKAQDIEKTTVSLSQEAIEKQKNAVSAKVDNGSNIQAEKNFDTERLKKIETLKAQIKSGDFKVDANALASKMLSDPEAVNNLLNN